MQPLMWISPANRVSADFGLSVKLLIVPGCARLRSRFLLGIHGTQRSGRPSRRLLPLIRGNRRGLRVGRWGTRGKSKDSQKSMCPILCPLSIQNGKR